MSFGKTDRRIASHIGCVCTAGDHPGNTPCFYGAFTSHLLCNAAEVEPNFADEKHKLQQVTSYLADVSGHAR